MKKQSNWPTTSKQSRGYGAEWDRKRKRVLKRDGYLCQCQYCKAEGRVRVADEVDHVISRAKAAALGWAASKTEDENNLQSIHHDCHKRKTREETGAEYKTRVKIGLDGFPLKQSV